MAEVTHQCPPDGSAVMPCCGRTPFEVSRWDRMTLDSVLVTCPVEWSTCARCGQGIWLSAEGVWCATEMASSAVCCREAGTISPHSPQLAESHE